MTDARESMTAVRVCAADGAGRHSQGPATTRLALHKVGQQRLYCYNYNLDGTNSNDSRRPDTAIGAPSVRDHGQMTHRRRQFNCPIKTMKRQACDVTRSR